MIFYHKKYIKKYRYFKNWKINFINSYFFKKHLTLILKFYFVLVIHFLFYNYRVVQISIIKKLISIHIIKYGNQGKKYESTNQCKYYSIFCKNP